MDPIPHLRQEHEIVRSQLGCIAQALAELDGPQPAEAVARLRLHAQQLDEQLRDHQEREEASLYPAIAQHHSAAVSEVLVAEHTDIRAAMTALRRALQRQKPEVGTLRRLGGALIALLENHVEKENTLLFGLVTQRLRPEESEALLRAMRRPPAGQAPG